MNCPARCKGITGNFWFNTFLYASARQELSTLQYELMKLLSTSVFQPKSAADKSAGGLTLKVARGLVTPVSIRTAITVMAAYQSCLFILLCSGIL
jgi:putative aldouronate transport system permease protein